MNRDLEAHILEANTTHYGAGDEIDAYLEEPHHVGRVSLAIEMLIDRAKSDSTPGLQRGLDLAAGTGKVAQRLLAAGFAVIACDASPEMMAVAAARNVPGVVADVTRRLPFVDREFDFVFAGEIVEHVFDTRSFLREIRRILRPNGCLVVTTPNLATLNDRFRFALGHSPRQVDAFHEYLHLHIRPFTMRSLKAALAESGFSSIEVRSHLLEIGSWRSPFLGRVLPDLGKSLVACCVAD